ncbi:NAD-dependent epimerase/dehydratase family protein [Corynebacterium diphtheriae]
MGILGSHGEVGRQVAALLRASGHVVNCGNRSHHTSDERTAIVDAHDEESVNKFSRDLDVVVNCAGPSCLLKTSVASALPDSVGYIDRSEPTHSTTIPLTVRAWSTPALPPVSAVYYYATWRA